MGMGVRSGRRDKAGSALRSSDTDALLKMIRGLMISVPIVGTLTNMMDQMARSAETADPLALEQQVCFALSVAARNVVAVYRPLLAPMGLTHPQYLVMLALWQHEPVS